jgi:ADP-ribose pyrophosphatase YjhB (NUDIX family)
MTRPPGPVVGVGVLVFRDNGVLLVRRATPPLQGEWSIPGGHAILGETVFETACREVREEASVIIRPLATIDVVDLIDRDENTGDVRRHFTLIEVLGAWVSGQPRPGDDASSAAWVDLAALDSRRLWSETRRVIDLAFSAWDRLGRP